MSAFEELMAATTKPDAADLVVTYEAGMPIPGVVIPKMAEMPQNHQYRVNTDVIGEGLDTHLHVSLEFKGIEHSLDFVLPMTMATMTFIAAALTVGKFMVLDKGIEVPMGTKLDTLPDDQKPLANMVPAGAIFTQKAILFANTMRELAISGELKDIPCACPRCTARREKDAGIEIARDEFEKGMQGDVEA